VKEVLVAYNLHDSIISSVVVVEGVDVSGVGKGRQGSNERQGGCCQPFLC
jgi:hypothetical protein